MFRISQKIIYPSYGVIAVDNDSEGNDVEVLRQKFGDYIYIIENDKNYGFAEGNNIAIRGLLDNSKPDYFLLLNIENHEIAQDSHRREKMKDTNEK